MVGSLTTLIVLGVLVAGGGVFLQRRPETALHTINQVRGVPYRPGNDASNRRAGVIVGAIGLVLILTGIAVLL